MTKNSDRVEVNIVDQGRLAGGSSPQPRSRGSSRRHFLHNMVAAGVLMGGLALPAAPSLAGTPAESEDFTSLFNGRDFTGWRFGDDSAQPKQMPEQWTIEQGVIKATGDAGPILASQWDYRNYHLRLEFLFSAPDPTDTNTGIYLRGVHPWQAEIWQHKWGCGLWGLRHGQPDLGKAVRPLVRMDNPPGQWNYIDVLVENNVVSVWLNGRTTINRYAMKKVDPRFPDSGGIALQSHGDGKEIRFRNIRVKTLD